MAKIPPENIVDLIDLEDLGEEFRETFSGHLRHHVQVKSEMVQTVPKTFRKDGHRYTHFEVRSDDVWITGIPRSGNIGVIGNDDRWSDDFSYATNLRQHGGEKAPALVRRPIILDLSEFHGTTLMEEMVWLIINDLDFERAKNLPPFVRTPYFEGNLEITEERLSSEPFSRNGVLTELGKFLQPRTKTLERLEQTKERRVIKTHFHFSLLPPEIFSKGCKVIYLARNPKDTSVSHYNLLKRYYRLTFKQYWELYKRGLVAWNPYWNHIEQAWARRDLPNFKFLFYEDYTQNLKKTVTEMSDFLEKPLTKTQIETLAESLSFDSFKKYRAQSDGIKISNSESDFVRKGKVGGWRDFFDSEMEEEADGWIEENSRRIGIQYPEC